MKIRLIATAAIFAGAAIFAVPANAFDGCHGNDRMVRSGPHAGQCAHIGGTSLSTRIRTSSFAKERHHRSSIVSATARVNDSSPGVIKIVTRHPFTENVAQYRCHIENGAIVRDPDDGGTGWCHD